MTLNLWQCQKIGQISLLSKGDNTYKLMKLSNVQIGINENYVSHWKQRIFLWLIFKNETKPSLFQLHFPTWKYKQTANIPFF